jgi:diacylglycerol kinase family enzyme
LATAIAKEFSGWEIQISADLPAAFTSPIGQTRPRTFATQRSGQAGPDLIVAVGGDGTANRVLNASVGHGVPLGILPCGTSNDLAHNLGIPRQFKHACTVIKQAHLAAIDLVAVNGFCFATCGGIGLPAAVAARANRWRRQKPLSWLTRLLGRGVYLLATCRELHHGAGSVWATVATNGGPRAGKWTAVIISNQSRFGGFCVAPLASNQDGRLNLCEIQAPKRSSRLFAIVRKAWQGNPETCPEIALRSAGAVRLFTPEAVPFMGDGEILLTDTVFRIRVVPEALSVVVPQTATTAFAVPPPHHPDQSFVTRRRRCG